MNLNLGRFLNINKIMLFKKKVIAIIPAKYNSSELSKKNFLKLKNKSLFEISIIAALKSNFIDEVFVSSDSNIILKKSKKIGAQIIKRNRNLSSKKSTANQVINDTINKIRKICIPKYEDFFIVYLQPTSPFRNHLHINKMFNLLKKNKINSAISVKKNLNTIYKNIKVKKNIIYPIFKKDYINYNRQNLPTTYVTNGAIYIFLASSFIKRKRIPILNSLAFEMSQNSSIDIDNLADFKFAKKISKDYLIY